MSDERKAFVADCFIALAKLDFRWRFLAWYRETRVRTDTEEGQAKAEEVDASLEQASSMTRRLMTFVVGSSALALPQQARADAHAPVDGSEGKDGKPKSRQTAAALGEDLWHFLSHQDAVPATAEGGGHALALARKSSLRRPANGPPPKKASQRKGAQPSSPVAELRLAPSAQQLPASASMPKFSLYSRFDPNLLKYLLIRTAQIEEYEFDEHKA